MRVWSTIILISAVLVCVQAGGQEPPGVVKNVIVYKESGRFAGWPANNGAWSWGNEIVVAFVLGYHDDEKRGGHPIKDPRTIRQARSLDGGETWTIEVPSFLDADGEEREPIECPGGIDFTDPDFALRFRCGAAQFYYSTDRAKKWHGPYLFPSFGRKGVLARTDYIVNGKHDLFAFLTSPKDGGNEGWPFCARTQDGGKTWQLVGWIGEQPPEGYGYAIMPSTVRLDSGSFLTMIRRGGVFDGRRRWWLETFLSPDEGQNWYMLDKPWINNAGNPASMILLEDGRIALTYGWRTPPYGIRVMISGDQGQTWGDEIVLRGDGDSWDIGYPRTVERPDGKIVTVYYFKDASGKERYIAATIWSPGEAGTQ